MLSDVPQVGCMIRVSFNLAVKNFDEFRAPHEVRFYVFSLDSVLRFKVLPESVGDHVDRLPSRAQVKVLLRPVIEKLMYPHFVRGRLLT